MSTWELKVKPNLDKIPEELKSMDRWLLWRAEKKPGHDKPSKVPYQTDGKRAVSTNSKTWTSFDAVSKAYESGDYSGVGFAVTDLEGWTFLDLDNCVDDWLGDEELNDKARAIVEAADSYTELSPSGQGVRVITKGESLPRDNAHDGVEVYVGEGGRYLTLTGATIEGRDTIKKANGALTKALTDVLGPTEKVHKGEVTKPLEDFDLERTRALLTALRDADPHRWDDEEDWMKKLVWPLHHQGRGDPDWMELAYEFSHNTSGVYEELESRWERATEDRAGGATLKSLIKEAQEDDSIDFDTRPPVTTDDFPDLDDEDEEDGEAPELPGWLKSAEDMRKTPPPEPLVEDLLYLRKVSMIAGEPGAGKSFLALAIARAVAAGTPLGGQRTIQGKVMYLAYEGEDALSQRLRALKVAGEDVPEGLVLGRPPVYLNEKGWRATLGETVRAFRPGLLVIDTLAAAIPGASTNDEVEVGKLVSALRTLAERSNCHVMVIHHPPKGGAANGNFVRGSGLILGDLDLLVYVEKDKDSGKVHATVQKDRSMGSQVELVYSLESQLTDVKMPWGQEKSAVLQFGIVAEDEKAETTLRLGQMLDTAIHTEGGNVSIDKGQWNTVRAEWLGTIEWPPGDVNDNTQKQREKRMVERAIRELRERFKFTRDGSSGGGQIKSVEYR